MIDLHSHILPGIDDGAKDAERSLELVRELASQGVTDIVATPHFITDTIYMSPRAENAKLLKELEKLLKREGIEVKLHLGNEIYINEKIPELFEAGEISGVGGSKYLLVELPLSGDYPNYEEIFRGLLKSGYRVILAHPERYDAFQKDFQLIIDLYEMGMLFQCNTGSFVGQYGNGAKKTVKKLAKNKMIFGMGTDIHHPRGEDWLEKTWKKMRKYYTAEELEQILEKNPREVLESAPKKPKKPKKTKKPKKSVKIND